MTEQEITIFVAGMMGLVLVDSGVPGMNPPLYYKGKVPVSKMTFTWTENNAITFNPFADANDDVMVLEAMNKKGSNIQFDFEIALKELCDSFHSYYKTGYYARAAFNVLQERMVRDED